MNEDEKLVTGLETPEESKPEPVIDDSPEKQPKPVEETHEKPTKDTKPTESTAENFRLMREEFERVRREKDEAERRSRDLESWIIKQQQQQPKVEDTEEPALDLGLADDDVGEGKHLKKLAKEIAVLRKELYQSQKQVVESSTEAYLKSRYPDFDEVVNKTNIDKLIADEPEIYRSISANPDLKSKAIAAYKFMKSSGYVPPKDVPPDTEMVKERIKENLAKPRSVSSVSPQTGDSPLAMANSFANGLTPDEKAALRKQNSEAIRYYSPR